LERRGCPGKRGVLGKWDGRRGRDKSYALDITSGIHVSETQKGVHSGFRCVVRGKGVGNSAGGLKQGQRRPKGGPRIETREKTRLGQLRGGGPKLMGRPTQRRRAVLRSRGGQQKKNKASKTKETGEKGKNEGRGRGWPPDGGLHPRHHGQRPFRKGTFWERGEESHKLQLLLSG